jgi:transposase-like protein
MEWLMAGMPNAGSMPAIDRSTGPQRGASRGESVPTPEERLVLATLNGPECRPGACPQCGGPRLQRWGLAAGLQRYRCSDCLRTCNPLTGTPLARLRRRDLWLGHAAALREGASLRGAARRLGVHHHTTFRWRHRWLRHPAGLQARLQGGIVEIAAVPFHRLGEGWSTGQRIAIEAAPLVPPADRARPPLLLALILCDRAARRTDIMLPRLDGPAIATAVTPLVSAAPVVLCSDGSSAFAAAARALGVPHRPCRAPSDDSAGGDLARVRGHVDRLAAWMQRFCGVSTRYLAHYLGWRRLLERAPAGPDPLAWLRLAIGQRPTANVGKAGRTGQSGRAGCRAGPGGVASPARRRAPDRPAGASRVPSARAAGATP